VLLNHGEDSARASLAGLIRDRLGLTVETPVAGQQIEI
jgi:hypothetical protein